MSLVQCENKRDLGHIILRLLFGLERIKNENFKYFICSDGANVCSRGKSFCLFDQWITRNRSVETGSHKFRPEVNPEIKEKRWQHTKIEKWKHIWEFRMESRQLVIFDLQENAERIFIDISAISYRKVIVCLTIFKSVIADAHN